MFSTRRSIRGRRQMLLLSTNRDGFMFLLRRSVLRGPFVIPRAVLLTKPHPGCVVAKCRAFPSRRTRTCSVATLTATASTTSGWTTRANMTTSCSVCNGSSFFVLELVVPFFPSGGVCPRSTPTLFIVGLGLRSLTDALLPFRWLRREDGRKSSGADDCSRRGTVKRVRGAFLIVRWSTPGPFCLPRVRVFFLFWLWRTGSTRCVVYEGGKAM